MANRTITNRLWKSLLAASLVVAGAGGGALGREVPLKDQADYNRSMAALLGGMGQIKAANANALTQLGNFKETLVKIQELQEKIRAAKMANDLKAAQDFYEKRKMNAQYREARRRKPLAREKLQELAKNGAPARLTAHQISPSSSRVKWPHVLTAECYDQTRAKVERLMAERTGENSGSGTLNCEQIQQAVRDMKAALKEQTDGANPMEYLAAKNFLDSLAFEARFVVQPKLDAVASN